jgi:uncharacterized protein YqgV (UPF0045/DUF77 family)
VTHAVDDDRAWAPRCSPNGKGTRPVRLAGMLVAFSVAPSGSTDASQAEGSVSEAVAAAVRIVRDSGLPHRTDSMFTTVEGEWDECMDVVRRACEAVGEYGPRVSLVLKADIRPGHTGELTGKLDRLEQVIARDAGA